MVGIANIYETRRITFMYSGSLATPIPQVQKNFDDQVEVFWQGYDTTALSSQLYFEFGTVLL